MFHRLVILHLTCLAVLAQERVPWTTSRVQGTPEPPPPFVVERLYPNLTFVKPLDVSVLPGTNRLVVLEQSGNMYSFVPEGGAARAELFGRMTDYHPEVAQSYALTFHPRFQENRFVFTWAVMDLKGQALVENGTHIVRFRVTEESPPRIDPASAKLIITWAGGGHNGGNMRFGPDGMLYICTGDATAPDPPDSLATGQDINDLLSSVLRIDVDHPSDDKAYAIPEDNPFVHLPKARGEVWAYGLRNPWRMSFNPKNGDLFAGDVGWELWEMIYRIQRGGNYGWSLTEGGKQDVRPERPRGPTPIVPPLVAHSHEEAASITGGEFYHGEGLPELTGAYLYGDWQMGTFWSLRTEGENVTEQREIARSSLMPAGFGIGHDGECIIVDHSGGGLWQFAKNPRHGLNSTFPLRLSDTGLFNDTAAQSPAPGVQPYEILAPRWADHAVAQRWAAFPGLSGVAVATESKGVVQRNRWAFPAGAVLAKTYSLEMERGNSATRRRIETQILHFDGSLWGYYTYRWNADQTDAELVPKQGDEATFTVKDLTSPGGEVRQRWRFYSRSECARCHTLMNQFAQSFSARQLGLPTAHATGNQLDAFTRLGLTPPEPAFADPYGTQGSLSTRARSYLHVNCSVCHRFNSGGGVPSRMDIDTAIKEAQLLNARPVQGDLGLPDARVIATGDPARSVLLYRMATAGSGHMPYLGAQLIDDRGLLLLRDWIASMSPDSADVLAPGTITQRKAENLALEQLLAGDATKVDTLLATNSGALSLLLVLLDGQLSPGLRAQTIAKGSAQTEPLRRDLFERFLPDAQRRQVLGPRIAPAALLAIKGDADRGKVLFAGVCMACHRVKDAGIHFGPDLSLIGKKWNRAAMLEQILTPSKVIDPEWKLTTLELNNGSSKAGFITARSNHELTLNMPGGLTEQIATAQVTKTAAAPVSMMPEGLLQNLTAQEAADLLEYLDSLK